jgi:hypothetical protein
MMNSTKTLLMSVAAAALLAGISVASAQAPGSSSAPAEKMGPALKEPTGQGSPAAKSGEKAAEQKADGKMDKGGQVPAPKGTTGQAPGGTAPTVSQAPAESKGDMKSKATRSESTSPGKSSTQMKADTKADAKIDGPAKSTEKAGDTKAAASGQGAAGPAASLSTEQRTTIRTVVNRQNVKPMTNVNFSISVGARVPSTVRFYPVPTELVTIYPSWRGYDYFLVGDQIIVVNPRTHDIVAVLDA